MNYPKDFINKIICGDCLEVMKDISDNSVDLVVTSPPYDNLRDYEGYEFNFKGIAKELFRIIKVGGAVVWVVGDATINGSETGTSFKQALYFKEIGFNLHDTMIYQKDKPPITSKRYQNCFEYMFIFSKGQPITFNPIKINCNLAGRKDSGSTDRQRDGKKKKRKTRIINNIKIKDNIWKYEVGFNKTTKDKYAYEHPAMFPEKLAKDHIISWSNKGDLVLDPMCGSGTTCKMAKQLCRKFIGIEISEKYCEIARQRLRQEVLPV